MDPRRSVLAPELERWCEGAGDDERRTVIVRLGFSADHDGAAADLGATGLAVQSAQPGSVVGVATPPVLRQVVRRPGVVAVEEPRRMLARPAPALGS